MSLAGKVAVVTGAARGIGKAVATHLASEGATVVIADINAKAAGETAAELEAAGRTAMGCPLDVTNPAQVAAMVEAVLARYGRIDILVNNAGITRDALILRMKEEGGVKSHGGGYFLIAPRAFWVFRLTRHALRLTFHSAVDCTA